MMILYGTVFIILILFLIGFIAIVCQYRQGDPQTPKRADIYKSNKTEEEVTPDDPKKEKEISI